MTATYDSDDSGACPQPDPMPIDAEMMAMRQTQTPQVTLNQSTSDETLGQKAPKPEVPKKSKHLEEVYRLRQQLSELQDDNEHVRDAIGTIALDLGEAEQQLISKTKELEQRETELATARETTQALLSQLDQAKQNQAEVEAKLQEREAELAKSRESMSLLSAQLDTERQTQARVEEKLREQKASTQVHSSKMQQQMECLLAALEGKGVNGNEEVSRLQGEVIRLTSLVSARDEELKNRDAANGESERCLKNQLQDQEAQLGELKKKEAMALESEKRLEDQLHEQKGRLEEEIKLRETAEATLGAQEQKASTNLEMAELRRLCDYYMENSQRLSKQINTRNEPKSTGTTTG